ncbi:MAG: transglutaminase N-terminal domain-containing protein [Pirellulales bacterium]
MKYRVTHITRYAGDQPVSICHNEAWLQPRNLPRQQCGPYELTISPAPSYQTSRQDYFGNHVAMFSFYQGYEGLVVTSKSEVTVTPRVGTLPFVPAWEMVRDRLSAHADPQSMSAYEFVFESPRIRQTGEVAAYARESFAPGRPLLEAVGDLTARIHRDFEYKPFSSTVTTAVDEVFRNRKGVCQDFAHLQIAALRGMGLAARYVSGYLRTYPAAGKPRMVGADASHAWLSVYAGDAGWIDVDPTNNIFPSHEHITVAFGRDYGDVCPLKGVYIGGGRHALTVNVEVTPLGEIS